MPSVSLLPAFDPSSACRTLVQAPVPAAVIDKGIPTAGLLAQVLVAKHADHLPLYRQEAIFGRAGLAIPRSTLGAWVGQCGARLEPVAQALVRLREATSSDTAALMSRRPRRPGFGGIIPGTS